MDKKTKKVTIGERIKEIFDQRPNLSVAQFAKLMNCDTSNIYNLFRRKKIDIELLIRVSKVLNHDFVEEICANNGYSRNKTGNKVSIILEINAVDFEKLNTVKRLVKQLKIKSIQVISTSE